MLHFPVLCIAGLGLGIPSLEWEFCGVLLTPAACTVEGSDWGDHRVLKHGLKQWHDGSLSDAIYLDAGPAFKQDG